MVCFVDFGHVSEFIKNVNFWQLLLTWNSDHPNTSLSFIWYQSIWWNEINLSLLPACPCANYSPSTSRSSSLSSSPAISTTSASRSPRTSSNTPLSLIQKSQTKQSTYSGSSSTSTKIDWEIGWDWSLRKERWFGHNKMPTANSVWGAEGCIRRDKLELQCPRQAHHLDFLWKPDKHDFGASETVTSSL